MKHTGRRSFTRSKGGKRPARAGNPNPAAKPPLTHLPSLSFCEAGSACPLDAQSYQSRPPRSEGARTLVGEERGEEIRRGAEQSGGVGLRLLRRRSPTRLRPLSIDVRRWGSVRFGWWPWDIFNLRDTCRQTSTLGPRHSHLATAPFAACVGGETTFRSEGRAGSIPTSRCPRGGLGKAAEWVRNCYKIKMEGEVFYRALFAQKGSEGVRKTLFTANKTGWKVRVPIKLVFSGL